MLQLNFFEAAIIGQRQEQQDYTTNLLLSNGYQLYLLADGMGGQRGGSIASRTIGAAFREAFTRQPDFTDGQAALHQALEQANQVIVDLIRQQPHLNGMGSTVIALLIHPESGDYHFISVGDSPLYHWRGGELNRINANHAYYEALLQAVAAGELSQAEADDHPDRHAITSAVMGKTIELIDCQSGRLAANERLLLASDGVQTLSDQRDGELATLLANQTDPTNPQSSETLCQIILAAVTAKGDPQQDNATLIIISATTPADSAPNSPPVTPPIVPSTQRLPPASTGLKRWYWVVLLILTLLVAALLWSRQLAETPSTASAPASEATPEPLPVEPTPLTEPLPPSQPPAH
ncbi:MAG: serine/threonine-protein phosphatase [Gammaproteobacteria bacterium]|nr:serine/threonine-protein phosphatase [Gammaproteobacteria bacterium]